MAIHIRLNLGINDLDPFIWAVTFGRMTLIINLDATCIATC
jgi:hypothetical protein